MPFVGCLGFATLADAEGERRKELYVRDRCRGKTYEARQLVLGLVRETTGLRIPCSEALGVECEVDSLVSRYLCRVLDGIASLRRQAEW